MKFQTVTFTLGRIIPLFPLSGDPADEYANLRPEASATVVIEEGDNPTEAFEAARSVVVTQLHDFSVEFRTLYKDRARARREKQQTNT